MNKRANDEYYVTWSKMFSYLIYYQISNDSSEVCVCIFVNLSDYGKQMFKAVNMPWQSSRLYRKYHNGSFAVTRSVASKQFAIYELLTGASLTINFQIFDFTS